MQEGKRLVKNMGIIAIGNLSTKLVSFFLLPLYTAVLSTEEYGTVDYIVSIALFLVPFVSLLMDESMFRFLIDCKTEEQRSRVISESLLIILAGGILFSLIAVPVLAVLDYAYSVYVIAYVLSSVLSTMMSALLRGIGRTDRYALFNFLTSFANIALNILFIAVLHWGVQGMLLAAILSQVAVPVVFFIWGRLWRYITLRGLRAREAGTMIRYSLPLIPNKLSWNIINLANRILIMNTLGSGATGLYAVAHKFPTLVDTVYGFFYQSWKESSARVMDDAGRDDFYNAIYAALKDLMYALVLGMTAFMPLAFAVLVDPAYHDALTYVPILLLGMYFSNMSGFLGGIFTAYKDTKIMGTTTICAAAISLAVTLLLIRPLGLYAAAASTLVSNLVVYGYRRMKVGRYVALKEDHRRRALALLATAAVLALFYTGSLPFRAIGCGISVVYAVAVNLPLLRLLVKSIRKA